MTARPMQPDAEQQQRDRRHTGEDQDAQKPPATANACGRENSCLRNSLGRLVDWLLRVTSRPAASEIRNAGTWLTRPSPMVSLVKTARRRGASDMPAWITPMNRPPTMLISVITMPAMASPRTNLLAPSIAPKKSACWVISSRRRWASCSSMMPAFRSASMAIWRPGMPSKANRAATSLIRVAPLVMTTNWITTMIAKMISPTTIWLPATNSPNVFDHAAGRIAGRRCRPG